jgi:hypothetical protein
MTIPFRRQFVVARAAVALDESWREVPLDGGWILSHQADLTVSVDRSDPGRTEVVLGTLLCRDAATGNGAGRYVRISGPTVTTDPVALLSVYHGSHGDARAIASSPALVMRALTGRMLPPDIKTPLDHRGAINFVPVPGSRWHGVRRLFADQAYDLATGALSRSPQGIRPLESFDAAVDVAAEGLTTFMRELSERTPGTIYLPLTAGRDSRTLAAALLAAGVRFETMTFRFVGKPDIDATIAGRISRAIGVRHQVLQLETLVPSRSEPLVEIVGGAYDDWDISHLFPGNGYRYLKGGDAMLVGGCFAIGRRVYNGYFEGLDFERATGAEIWEQRSGTAGPPELTTFLDDWKEWRSGHLAGLDWSTAFYVDQRLTGWRAALEQGYDLLDATALHPANDAQVLSAFITPGPAEQASAALQSALIERLAPELMRFPLNPVPLARRLRRLPRRVARAIGSLLPAARA